MDRAADQEWRDTWLSHPQAQAEARRVVHLVRISHHVVFSWTRGNVAHEVTGWGGNYNDALQSAVREMRGR